MDLLGIRGSFIGARLDTRGCGCQYIILGIGNRLLVAHHVVKRDV